MPYPSLLHPELLSLWQATADPYLCRRHSNRVLAQSLAESPLLSRSPGAQGSVCALLESVSQSCVSFGGSMVG